MEGRYRKDREAAMRRRESVYFLPLQPAMIPVQPSAVVTPAHRHWVTWNASGSVYSARWASSARACNKPGCATVTMSCI